MKFNYGEFDGQGFMSPDMLFPPTKVVQFILQYGQDALDAMGKLENPDEQQYIQMLIDAGLLERDEKTGELRMTPRLLRGMESKALMEIFQNMNKGTKEGHQAKDAGRSDERAEGTKSYEFGDPLSEIDLATTMRNAFRRQRNEQGTATLPLHIQPDDFEIHLTDSQTDVATVMLMDLSGSMMRYGRFYHAKRVALGMAELVRQRFSQDTIDYIGFSSLAEPIAERDLPLVMPKPISTRDYEVRVRVPLAQAYANPAMIPQHFTNLQLGLRMARQTLARRGARNKQIFIITDGQPTAHVQASTEGGEEMLYLLYPPSQQTTDITLQEALRCHQQGIRIATFALIEDYWGMDWVGFVDKLTRLIRGTAFYCASDDLSSIVVESYLNGKRAKKFHGT